MPVVSYTIKKPSGLHARPVRSFAEKAATYPCEIKVTKGPKTVNGKSTIAMLTLGVKFNETVTVEATGEQADEALAALGEILNEITEE
jgi:phosphocarrier protein HPr